MKTKKLLSVILAFAMIISLMPTVGLADVSTLTVEGSDVFISAQEGKYSKVAYKVMDGTSDVSANATVVVKKDGDVATDAWYVDGNLVVQGGAQGTYTLTASYNNAQSEPKSVNITKSKLYDWSTDSTSTGTFLLQTDDKGNKYAAPTTEGNKRIDITTDKNTITSGIKTFAFDFKAAFTTSGTLMVDSSWKMYIKKNATSNGTFNMETWIDNYYNDGQRHNKYIATSRTHDDWHNMKILYNMDTKQYTVYIDGVANANATNLNLMQGQSTSAYKFMMGIDNVIVYSGTECESPLSLKISGNKSVLIPQSAGKKAQVKFDIEEGILDTTGAVWSISDIPNGVTIDPATGLITVTDTVQPCTLTVKAQKGQYYDTAILNLEKINITFDDQNGGYLTTSSSQGKYTLNDYTYIGNDSNIVIEFNAKKHTNNASNLNIIGSTDWKNYLRLDTSAGYSNPFVNNGNWHTVKIVLNIKAQTFDWFINGNKMPNTFTASGKEYNTKLEGFSSDYKIKAIRFDDDYYVDDLKIYNVNNFEPVITGQKISNAIKNNTAEVSYTYLSDDGSVENGTTFQWKKCAIEGGTYTDIPGATSRTLEITDDIVGNYIKVIITPKHLDQFDSSAYITGEPIEVTAYAKNDLEISYTVRSNDDDTPYTPGTPIDDGKYLTANVEITQIDNTTRDFMIAIVKYTDSYDEILSVDSNTLKTTKKGGYDNKNIVIENTGGKMKLFVWDRVTLTPVRCDIIK